VGHRGRAGPGHHRRPRAPDDVRHRRPHAALSVILFWVCCGFPEFDGDEIILGTVSVGRRQNRGRVVVLYIFLVASSVGGSAFPFRLSLSLSPWLLVRFGV
jgi:hypothetical protein